MASELNPFADYDFTDEELAKIEGFSVIANPKPVYTVYRSPNDVKAGWLGRRGEDIVRGSKQIEALAGGTLYAGGKPVGWEDLQNYSEAFTRTAEQGVEINSPRVGSLADTKNFGDICEYGAEVFLESIPLFMFSMIAVLLFRKARKVVTDWLQVRVIQ